MQDTGERSFSCVINPAPERDRHRGSRAKAVMAATETTRDLNIAGPHCQLDRLEIFHELLT